MGRVILSGKMIGCSFLSCEYCGDVIQERVAGVLFFHYLSGHNEFLVRTDVMYASFFLFC